MIGAGMGAAILNAFGVYCAEPAAAVHPFLLSLVLSVAFVLYVILKTPNGRAPEPSPPPAVLRGTEK